MFTKMTLAGLDRDVPHAQVEHYKLYGWQVVESKTESVVDSGKIQAKSPKKKAPKPAETAPEAAQEDLDNAINTGE
jgi:hypothetical protein